MDQSRRSFFRNMIAAGLAATVDVDKLLWTPGEKVYSIPPVVRAKKKPLELWIRGAQYSTWEERAPSSSHAALFREAITKLNALPPGAPRVVSSWGKG